MAALLTDPKLLARLVAFETTSTRGTAPLADFVCGYVDRPGVRLRENPAPDGRQANLLIEAGPEVDPGRRDGLLLAGHMDVVPASEDGWRSDPFTLTDDGDWYVARGACDMKGFLALALNLVARLDPARLRHPLGLLLTYDEELGTLGAQHFVRTAGREWPLPRVAVIGEPTSLAVVRMHKGHLKLRLALRGEAAHSSQPHLGRNAIEAAARAVAGLAALRETLAAERPAHAEHFPEAPFVTLNLGTIEGGTAINVVPDRCVLDLGVRLLPGMRSADLVERVRAAVGAAAPEAKLEILGDSPPLLTAESSPACRALGELVGSSPDRGVSFSSDGGALQELGVEPVLFGPGSVAAAHRANEFLPRLEFERCGGVLEELVDRLCVQEVAAAARGPV